MLHGWKPLAAAAVGGFFCVITSNEFSIMHFYICPYCEPCSKAKLTKVMLDAVKCKYDNEDVCAENHKCKEVMRCKKCKEEWTYSLKFLREQKRKIKDG